jgi:NAD(P)-dependent dehydrogenase (short-subunit alcohol dehydrogenase family)
MDTGWGRRVDTDLTGRVAVVTGGARNIGRAICQTLADAGAQVAVVWQSSETGAKETVEAITAAGNTARTFRLNLLELDSIPDTVSAIEEALGPVDILVNNAAIRPERDLAAVTPELWDEIFGINVKGPFFLTQRVLPGMIERRWGRVINLGGLHGYIGSSHRTHVHASKQAVLGMTRGIAYEGAPYGVTANVVVPGRIATTRGPAETYGAQMDAAEAAKKVLMQRMGKPQEIASMVLYLASDQAAYISGQEMFVTGGVFPLVPGL